LNKVSESDLAALKQVADSAGEKLNGKPGASVCMFCGFKYVPPDNWRPLGEACDACYEKVQGATAKNIRSSTNRSGKREKENSLGVRAPRYRSAKRTV